jgi:hypothetical protein
MRSIVERQSCRVRRVNTPSSSLPAKVGRRARAPVARSQHDINIVCIVRQTRGQPARMFDACFTQAAFERGVACQDRNALIRQLLDPLPVALDHDELIVGALQSADQVRSNAACATDDKMVPQFAHHQGTT